MPEPDTAAGRPQAKPRASRVEVDLPDQVGAMVEIVERDHARANAFSDSLGTTRSALFAFAGSLWTAAIAAAFATNTWVLCPLAAAVLLLIAYIDSTISAHTRAVRAQLRRLEHVLDANYRLLLRGESPHTKADLVGALTSVEIGQVSLLKSRERRLSLQRVDPRRLGRFVQKHRSKVLVESWRLLRKRAAGFTTRADLQMVFILVLAVLAAALAFAVPDASGDDIRLCVQADSDAVISVTADEIVALKGPIHAVACP